MGVSFMELKNNLKGKERGMPTILRSLMTRVLPFLSPPTVFTTVVGGFAFSFFSICSTTNTF